MQCVIKVLRTLKDIVHIRQDRGTRFRRRYLLPARISARYKSSPSLTLVSNINNILSEINDNNSFEKFKRNRKSKLYPIHNRTPTTQFNLPIKDAKFLNRMRVGLCLKTHQFAHNFDSVNDPKCQCGYRTQNENHFFLDCPMLNDNRTILLHALDMDAHFANLSKSNKIKFLLYGDISLTSYNNEQILKATSKFIIHSKHLLNLN